MGEQIRNPLRCVVIEDEIMAIEMMTDYIGRRNDLALVDIVIHLSDVKQSIDTARPALIFLDFTIIDGVDDGLTFDMLPEDTVVITVSALPSNQFTVKLPKEKIFELLKPFSFEQFSFCVDQIIKKYPKLQNGTIAC
ncbi:MAG: hypothetical protein ACTHZ7_08785 [Sphingobacterium sp.]